MGINDRFNGGTPYYAGKSVCSGVESIQVENCKADIYAMGVTFFNLF